MVVALGWERRDDEGCSSESHKPLESKGGEDTEPVLESEQGAPGWLLRAMAGQQEPARLLTLASPGRVDTSSEEELS